MKKIGNSMKKYRVQINMFFLLSFIYIDAGFSADEGMKVYTYKPALFEKKREMTEQKVYEILSAHPIKKNVNYLAVPWVPLYNQKELQKVKLPNRLNGGFTVCQHVRYRVIIPVLRKLGVNVLFASHASKEQEYEDIIVLPFPLYPTNGIGSAQKKNILYSFIGTGRTHPVRKKIFTLPPRPDVVIKKRIGWHFLRWGGRIIRVRRSSIREQEKKEFQDVLSRSRFSLCPWGYGQNTIRFWESLQAGAIPVLLADRIALPEIEGINWDDCIVRVPEKDTSSVDSIIRAIPPEKEECLRENCLRAFSLSCAGENFVQTIRDYFEKKA